tara:strand:- start:23309 stop:24625 length:1317 start_codon:yes stop_codon:yes gene_type:complete
MKKLTIGSAVYDDYEGVYFTYQSLRLNNQDIIDDIEFIIIDNNPESVEGKAVKQFCKSTSNIRYIPFTERRSTAVRNEIFNNAEGEFCMSIDCHVLFESGTIKRLINYFEKNSKSDDLFHGPMFYDDINKNDPVTHMDPVWRDSMFGVWGVDKRGGDPDNKPFEIPMHGCGILAARTDSWLGFSEQFIGFGGEEGYIHEKYRQHKRKILCLPFLRWLHRFNRPRGVPYNLDIKERIRNYIVGYRELDMPLDSILEHFSKTHPHISIQNLIDEIDKKPNLIDKIDKKPNPINKPLSSSDIPSEIKLWENSCVNFNKPSNIRYLKYHITDSYDGHASILKVDIESDPKIEPKIQKFSSESPINPAEFLLKEGRFWETNDSMKGVFPHEIILDLGFITKINKITTYPRVSMQKGLPTKFKIYASNNLVDWHLLSDVDILKD